MRSAVLCPSKMIQRVFNQIHTSTANGVLNEAYSYNRNVWHGKIIGD
jgi:hypothetical protein